jgi:hypothetical protein
MRELLKEMAPTNRWISTWPRSCGACAMATSTTRSLVYRKNLRKDTEQYTATTPPHVAAARKSTQARQRLIS